MWVPYLVKMNNIFCQYLQVTVLKNLSIFMSLYSCHHIFMSSCYPLYIHVSVFIVSRFMPSDRRDGRTMIKLLSIVGFIEKWGEQTRFYFWRYSAMACRKLSHFNSRVFIFDFTWNCCKLQGAKKFQGTQITLSVLLEKPDITYPSPNS